MFGKSKTSEPASPKRKKGGLLKAIGIEASPAPTADDVQRAERHKKIEQAWEFLRASLDRAVSAYYETGSFDELAQHAERPALDAIKQQLITLRGEQLYWQMNDRRARSQPRFEVVGEELNKRGQPTKFVIEERFRDYSELLRITDQGLIPLKQGDGTERAIQATVHVQDGRYFKLQSVIAVTDKTL